MSVIVKTKARRSWFVPRCASRGAVLVLFGVACLNPRPEELPSYEDEAPPNAGPADGSGAPAAGFEGAAGAPVSAPINANDPSPQPGSTNPESEEPVRDAPDAGADGGREEPPLADPSP